MIKENNAVACVQLNHAGRYAVTDHPLLPSAMDSTEIEYRCVYTPLKKYQYNSIDNYTYMHYK